MCLLMPSAPHLPPVCMCLPACLPAAEAGLSDSSLRVQQASATFLCLLLCSPRYAHATTQMCFTTDTVLEGLSTLMDSTGVRGAGGPAGETAAGPTESLHGIVSLLLRAALCDDEGRRSMSTLLPDCLPCRAAEVLQGKALVVLALLCRNATGLARVAACEGLLDQAERLCSGSRGAREWQGGGAPPTAAAATATEQYTTAAVAALLQQIPSNAVQLLRQAAAAAQDLSAGLVPVGRQAGEGASRRSCGGGSDASSDDDDGMSQPLDALQQLLSSATYRPVAVSAALIAGLAEELLLACKRGQGDDGSGSDSGGGVDLAGAGGLPSAAVHQELKVCAGGGGEVQERAELAACV